MTSPTLAAREYAASVSKRFPVLTRSMPDAAPASRSRCCTGIQDNRTAMARRWRHGTVATASVRATCHLAAGLLDGGEHTRDQLGAAVDACLGEDRLGVVAHGMARDN